MDRSPPADTTSDPPRRGTRGPWLVIVIVVIIVAAIAAFLVLRPGGSGTKQANPAASPQ